MGKVHLLRLHGTSFYRSYVNANPPTSVVLIDESTLAGILPACSTFKSLQLRYLPKKNHLRSLMGLIYPLVSIMFPSATGGVRKKCHASRLPICPGIGVAF